MTIEELEIQKKDNAVKAKQILEAEDGIVEDAQKLISENEKINEKIEALKSVKEQMLPVEPKKEEKVENETKIEYKSARGLSKLPFEGTNDEKGRMAYAWGKVALAASGNKKAIQWLNDNPQYKAANEGTNSAGGFLVPDILMDSIIWLRDKYGVVRRNSDVRTMTSDTLLIPKNATSPTVYWPGENTAITESSPVFDQVSVVAKKLGILSQVSSELNEDSVVELGAHLADDFAWRIEQEIDRVAMLGASANAADGNIDGFITANLAVGSNAGTVAAASGTVANYNAVTLANFRTMVGLLPLYADRPGEVKWYMSKRFFNDVVCNRLDALSGNAALDIMNFNNGQPTLFGYPIEFSQHLASTPAGTVNTHLCAFGNLKTGLVYGDRRDFNIKMSEHYYFNADALAFRGTARVGIKAHDVGTSSAAGSIIVLKRTT